ncbi:DNA-3-methyladenine glycosylase 2 family protein [Listeria monocytogenes]|nr:DNA-3-methyladenine glycosylase 2 family protein [Listeria monocytogenes]
MLTDTKKYSLSDTKIKYLVRTDQRLERLITYIGPIEYKLESDGFKCLVKYIIGQQISDKARETIWQKFCLNLANITPRTLLSIDNQDLRTLGLSARKVDCIKTLAAEILSEQINFEQFSSLSNKEIVSCLTKIKGIGKWTAEMYLIFSLGRENVLSYGDGTIKRAIQWMYNLESLPSDGDLTEYFVSWEGQATIVALYFWKSVEVGLMKKAFDEAMSGQEMFK